MLKKLQIFQYYPFSVAPVCKFKAYTGNCYKTYRKGLYSKQDSEWKEISKI